MNKRLVFVLPWAELAGAERQALTFAGHLVDRGAVVDVCALTDVDGPAIEAFRAAGACWKVARTDWHGTRREKAAELVRLVRALRSIRPDVLLPYCTPANVLCGLVWRWAGASTCVWHQQDVLSSRFGTRLTRLALRRTPLVLSNSSHALHLLRRLGASDDQLRMVSPYCAVPTSVATRTAWRERLGVAEETSVVSMLATLGPNKDHSTLLRAWPQVVARMAEKSRAAVLLLAGRSVREGAERAKALAYDLELGRSVRFLGYVEDIAGLLDASDLAVLSSRSEGLPNAVVEPMAKGMLVVATDVPGTREAVGPTGVALFASVGDHEELAAAIVTGLEDGHLRREAHVRNPISVADRFGPETLELHAALIAGALGRRRRSGEDVTTGS